MSISYFRSQRERQETMLEKYGFLCDCQACTLTGDQRRRNNDERQLVVTLDKHIERHLYDFESEHNDNSDIVHIRGFKDIAVPGMKETDFDDEDLSDILTAIKLLYYKLHLMDNLGFKVVSQIAVCSYILEVCEEWDLVNIGLKTAELGLKLAERIYGRQYHLYKKWCNIVKNFNK